MLGLGTLIYPDTEDIQGACLVVTQETTASTKRKPFVYSLILRQGLAV